MLIESFFKACPWGIVTQVSQDSFEPIVTYIARFNRLTGQRTKRQEPARHPGFDMDEAMIASRSNRAEPNRANPARTQALPIAMGGKMLVNQRRQCHLLHLVNQQGDIVDALCDNMMDIVHTHSLAHLCFTSKFARTVS
jgi:hypothetical protein